MTEEKKTFLTGGDSATPKPDMYEGHKVWGVYVAGATFHVWTKEEVAALGEHGIEGVLPIVVPSQSEEWWQTNHGYAELESLVREAMEWGIPKGSPLVLDVEEGQSEKMAAKGDVARAWAVACRTHDLIPWAYGSASFLDQDVWSNRWLAEWPNETPTNPEVPEPYRGWQYKGDTDGIDLDVFRTHEIFLSPELKPVTLIEDGAVKAHDEVTESPAESALVSTPVSDSAASFEEVPAASEPDTVTDEVSSASTPPPAPASVTKESLHERILGHLDEIENLVNDFLEQPKS